MIHTFTKDNQGWYISSIPEPHPFGREELAMVSGADTFLHIISEGKDTITLDISDEYQSEGWESLERLKLYSLGIGGADYIIRNYKGIPYNHKMWLCSVTMWVFKGMHPKTIFFKVLD